LRGSAADDLRESVAAGDVEVDALKWSIEEEELTVPEEDGFTPAFSRRSWRGLCEVLWVLSDDF
jgi:hypothetical protein